MLKSIDNILNKTTQEKYNLNDNQRKIIELIKEKPTITRNEMASILDITSDGVKYNLKELTSLGIVKRAGSTKSGKWIIINEK